jgi:hypothetical protein
MSYAALSLLMASPPMKCSTRSMPIRIASRGLTEFRETGVEMPGHRQSIAMRLVDQANSCGA